MIESIDVIIPTRGNSSLAVSEALFRGLQANTPPITSFNIIIDNGVGQTRIRYEGTLESKSDYVLLLDDDVEMRTGVVQAYLDKIREGYDAVCGSTNPLPQNKFSKHVVQFMTNPSTPFYPVGCTLWKREKFIQIMNDIGLDVHKYVGDNLLGKQIIVGNYKVVRVEEAISDHLWCTTPSKFIKKRISNGEALAELYLKEGTFIKNYLKFSVSIPLSTRYGLFLYRLGTWIGLTKGVLKI